MINMSNKFVDYIYQKDFHFKENLNTFHTFS